MINVVSIVVCIASFSIQSLQFKKLSDESFAKYLLFLASFSFLIFLGFLPAAILSPGVPLHSILPYGIASGLTFGISVLTVCMAMRSGPLSYTVFFVNSSMLITVIAGALIWQETFSWYKILGIVLLLAAFLCISFSNSSAASGAKSNMKWLLLCFTAWLGNGTTGVIQKMQQMNSCGLGATHLVALLFLVTAIVAFAASMYLSWKKRSEESQPAMKSLIQIHGITIFITALCTGLGNYLITLLSGKMDGSLLFPLTLGGTTLAVTMLSFLLYKERINYLGITGIAVGLLSLFLLCQ